MRIEFRPQFKHRTAPGKGARTSCKGLRASWRKPRERAKMAKMKAVLGVNFAVAGSLLLGGWLAGCSHPSWPATDAAPPQPWLRVQQDEGGGGDQVKPEDVEKYIKVYQAMQRNRALTVDQATAQQHLNVAQFREIEEHIERDGVLRERVRSQLLKSAKQRTQSLAPSPAP